MITLDPQDVLNKVVAHLNNGGTQSLGDFDSCKYRGYEGAKCFIGLCLPDDVAEEWDKRDFSSVSYLIRSKVVQGPVQALSDLQSVHDNYDHWSDGKFNDYGWESLKQWATENKLQWPADAEGDLT